MRLTNLQGALDQDIPSARTALQELLAPVKVNHEEEGGWMVEMTPGLGRLLMTAGGEVVAGCGSGGPLPDLETVRIRLR